jgi:hypothetical protein
MQQREIQGKSGATVAVPSRKDSSDRTAKGGQQQGCQSQLGATEKKWRMPFGKNDVLLFLRTTSIKLRNATCSTILFSAFRLVAIPNSFGAKANRTYCSV